MRSPLPESPLRYLCHQRLTTQWILALSLLCSALFTVYLKHLNQHLHTQIQQSREKSDRYHLEWTQLLLEKSALASDLRVEQFARDRLQMIPPPPDKIVMMRP